MAMAMADRVAVMDAGCVLQCDTPAEVWARPATTAVARVFGPLPMNLLPAVDGVVVGVRPERVRLAAGTDAVVRAGEPTGDEALVTVAQELLARVPSYGAPAPGDAVEVTRSR